MLCLKNRPLSRWLSIDRLELEVPGVSFPFDMSHGTGRFRTRRCRLVGMELSVRCDRLAETVLEAASTERLGFKTLDAEAGGPGLLVSGHVKLGDEQADFTIRFGVGCRPDGRVWVGAQDVRMYGALSIPPPLLGL